MSFKPSGYSSVSPYFVIRNVDKFAEFLTEVFGATVLRRYEMPDGSVMHMEMQLDDSVIMMGEASEKYPQSPQLTHVYVQKVDKIFERALAWGCTEIQSPAQRAGDPDRRGTFNDFAGNTWSVSTQLAE